MSVYQRVKFTPKNRTFLNRDRPPSEGLPWAPRALAGPVGPGVYIGGIWGFTISMATQEPIDWRYRFHIFLPNCLGLNFREYPQKIWPELGTNVPPFQDPGIPIDYWTIWKHVVSKSAICGFTMKTASVTIWWSYDITLLILNLWWFNSSRTGKPPVLRGNHNVYHLFLWATYTIAMFNKQRVTIGWYDIICLQYINDIWVGDPILI